jgi:hypothetical protein
MQIRFSVLARGRPFAKAMRRIRPSFQPLLSAIEELKVDGPHPDAILVGFTDDRGADFFEEVRNSEGFFQVLAGIDCPETDGELAYIVLRNLQRAAQACPLLEKDHAAIAKVFADFVPMFTIDDVA